MHTTDLHPIHTCMLSTVYTFNRSKRAKIRKKYMEEKEELTGNRQAVSATAGQGVVASSSD